MTPESDQQHNQNIIHTFLNYEVNPSLREIHQVKTPLKVSKKSFDILILLIEKQGQIVSKKEITDRVWPNQIVTDATLNKQITRLRNDLVSYKPTDQVIIETVRGVGIRLIPAVKSKSINQKGRLKVLMWIVPAVLALTVYLYSDSLLNKADTVSVNTATESVVDSYNIVLVPAKKSIDWLNVGGLDYLSTQLQKHPEIQTISPKIKWFNQDNTQTMAIDISQRDGIDYVLVVNNLEQGKTFTTDLLLRNKQGIFAKQSIQAENLNLMFEKINAWVSQQLKISANLTKGVINNSQPTEFALESYLRARELSLHKSYEKAAQLYQTAINEDPGFQSAKMALADVESELGNYKKSLAIIDALVKSKSFDHNLHNQLYTIEAKNLMFLNQYDQANAALDKSMQLSKDANDYDALVKAMTVKVVLHSNTNNVSQETIDILLEQLDILRKHEPDPDLIALASSNLAGTYQNLGQLPAAIKYAKIAVEMYTILNAKSGIVFSHTVLARIYHSQGDVAKALLTLDKINESYKLLDGIQVPRMFLQYKAENQSYLGLRNEALVTIDELLDLGLKYNDLTAKVIAYALLSDLHIIYKDYSSARSSVDQLLEIDESKPAGYVSAYKDIIFAYDLYVYALTEPADNASEKLQSYIKDNESFMTNYSKEVKKIEAIILNKQGSKIDAVKKYHELIVEYTAANQTLNALHSGYEILEIQWQNDMQDYVKKMLEEFPEKIERSASTPASDFFSK